MTRDPNTEKLPETASEWLLKMREYPQDPVLEDHLDTWLQSDDQNRQDWEDVSRLNDLLYQLEPTHESVWRGYPKNASEPSETNVLTFEQRENNPPQSFWRKPVIAVMTLAASVACVLSGLQFAPFWMADHRTGVAELKTIELEDGSRLTLAPNTALNIQYADGHRTVELVEGKSYFAVKRDERRPFIVRSGSFETTVLGTEFEIDHQAENTSLSVTEGLVSFEGFAPKILDLKKVKPGERISVTSDGTVSKSRFALSKAASWRSKKLIASNKPLPELIRELDNYVGGLIVLQGDKVQLQRVTGKYSLEAPEKALEAIALSHGARLYRPFPGLIIFSGS